MTVTDLVSACWVLGRKRVTGGWDVDLVNELSCRCAGERASGQVAAFPAPVDTATGNDYSSRVSPAK